MFKKLNLKGFDLKFKHDLEYQDNLKLKNMLSWKSEKVNGSVMLTNLETLSVRLMYNFHSQASTGIKYVTDFKSFFDRITVKNLFKINPDTLIGIKLK